MVKCSLLSLIINRIPLRMYRLTMVENIHTTQGYDIHTGDTIKKLKMMIYLLGEERLKKQMENVRFCEVVFYCIQRSQGRLLFIVAYHFL